MRVLVTGGTGFVGTALITRLLAGQFIVRGSVRRESSTLPAGAERVVVGDLAADTDWQQALAGVDTVIHLAARVHVTNETAAGQLAEFRRVNVAGTLSLARQATSAGVRRFAYVSSVKVNGETGIYSEVDPPMPEGAYGISKHEAELSLRQIAVETGMEVVIIRSPLVYGPGMKANFQTLVRAVALGMPLPLGNVHNRRSFVALDNLVDFIITGVVHPAAANETFFVSDGEDLSTTDLIRRVAGALGRPTRLVPMPRLVLMAVATVLGKRDTARRLLGSLQVDISKARRVLGWTPPVSVEEGLRRAIVLPQEAARSGRPYADRQGKTELDAANPMKRLFDVLLATAAAVIALGPFIVVALLVKLTSKGPILYWSNRVGRHNVIFKMPKFRSMKLGTPAVATHLLGSPDTCLTPIGKFLRRSSLDELPQLWSILRGEMSFVGPRPALFNQDDLIALRTQYGVDALTPGLTGWAQINGRDELPIPDKVALDTEYLHKRSMWFDMKIIGLTFLKVIRGDGISH